jgi:CheY-like chemotaxis protein
MSTPATAAKIEFFELGDKTSLVCTNDDISGTVRNVLHDLNYKFHTAENGDEAVDRLRYTQYNCIVLSEDFCGSTLITNAVLNYLAPLPMALRRNSFVCLVGPSFKTLDAMQAFVQSVHVVVNPIDIPNLAAILRKSLAEFEQHYRTFNQVLAARGEN